MEGFQASVRNAMSMSQEPNLSSAATTIASTFEKAKSSLNNLSSPSSSSAAAVSTPPPSSLLLTRQPRNTVSLGTCSKLCAAFFVAGVFVGFTLKRRVRRWASRLLRRLKDE